MARRIMRNASMTGHKRICEMCGEKVTKKTWMEIGCKCCRPSAFEKERNNDKN